MTCGSDNAASIAATCAFSRSVSECWKTITSPAGGCRPEVQLLAAIWHGGRDEGGAAREGDTLALRHRPKRLPRLFRATRSSRDNLGSSAARFSASRQDGTTTLIRKRVSRPSARAVHCDFFKSRARARSSARRSDAVKLLIPCLEILSNTGSMESWTFSGSTTRRGAERGTT